MENEEKSTTIHIKGGGKVYPPVYVRSSGKDVIASGTVHTFDSTNLEVQIAQFKFIFNFIEDQSNNRTVSFSNPEKETLKIDLYNFNNSLGNGTVKPYKIGSLMDRELYLGFNVYALSAEGSKTVHYSFMLGDQVNE